MKIGLMLPLAEDEHGQAASWAELRARAEQAEGAGLDSIWVYDHLLHRFPGRPTVGFWEAWTMLSALAAATRRVELGASVLCAGFRNPAVLAKMATTLDEVSGGRLILGLGAGWHEPEFDAFGLPFDHRVSRFEEALQIIAPLLRTGSVDVAGRFHRAADGEIRPRGPRPGGPPLLVAAFGPRMMRLTARYADAWNSDWKQSADLVVPMLEKLDEACADVGRDPATLVRTSSSNFAMDGYLGIRPDPITGDADAMAGKLAKFRDLSLRHHVAGLDPCTPASLGQFARVLEILDKHDKEHAA